jgi:transposase InsO family protein
MLVELSVMEQRYHAVMEGVSGAPVTEVARRYGVTRQAVYVWLGKYQKDGLAGLADHSHRPRYQPRQLDAGTEALICQLRGTHPRWGPRRLAYELGKANVSPVPSRSTIYRVLVRRGLVPARKRKRRRQDHKRWQRDAPMRLWQLDITGSVFLTDGTELKLISGLDDHSRFCVIATVVRRGTARAVCRAFLAAMLAYGIPDEVLTDNCKQFTGRFGKPRPAEVLFERICRRNGIRQLLTRPYSPTTTGKVERWHQTLQLEFLNDAGPFASIEEAQAAVDAWREEYNQQRPHQSRDPGRLGASLEGSVGHPAYNTSQLRADLDRFTFLLGGSDGEPSSVRRGDNRAPERPSRPAQDTPGLTGLNVVRPRAARSGRSTLTPAAAPALTGTSPGMPEKLSGCQGRPATGGDRQCPTSRPMPPTGRAHCSTTSSRAAGSRRAANCTRTSAVRWMSSAASPTGGQTRPAPWADSSASDIRLRASSAITPWLNYR